MINFKKDDYKKLADAMTLIYNFICENYNDDLNAVKILQDNDFNAVYIEKEKNTIVITYHDYASRSMILSGDTEKNLIHVTYYDDYVRRSNMIYKIMESWPGVKEKIILAQKAAHHRNDLLNNFKI